MLKVNKDQLDQKETKVYKVFKGLKVFLVKKVMHSLIMISHKTNLMH